MFAVQPVKIYPGVQICQIFYHEIAGDITQYESTKYQNNRYIQPSLLYRELNPEAESESPQMTLNFKKRTKRGDSQNQHHYSLILSSLNIRPDKPTLPRGSLVVCWLIRRRTKRKRLMQYAIRHRLICEMLITPLLAIVAKSRLISSVWKNRGAV